MRKSLLLTLEFPPQKGGTQTYYFNICKNLPSDKIVVLAPIDEWDISSPRRSPLTGDCGGVPEKPSPNPSAEGGVERCPTPYMVSDTLSPTDFKIYRENLLVRYLYPHWILQVWHLYKIAKKEKIELIQVGQVLPCGTAAFLVSKFFKIPYVVYTHGLDILGQQKNLRKKNLMIKILRSAEKVISNSEFTKNEVARLGIDNGKIFVVYPGVTFLSPRRSPLTGDCGGAQKIEIPPNPPLEKRGDATPVLRKIEELREKYNLDGKKILLSVCRLVERKGIDLVISALASFSEELKNVVYIVAGDGSKMEDLRKLTTGCPQVIFTGRVSDEELDLWYRICDVFILTPKKSEFDVEGFGIVYIEAGGYSKPVIGSRLAGICEAVDDGVTGILVEPDNIEQIGKAIIKLFSDEDLRERLGRQGRERAEREFGIERMAGRLREVIE